MEQWRDVSGYEGFFEVSDLGKVRSLPRSYTDSRGQRCRVKGKTLNHVFNSAGYPMVNLCANGKQKLLLVHVLVLSAFVSARPAGMQGCHNDGNPKNPTLSNLRWDTPKGNSADTALHGTRAWGSKQGQSKLTENDVSNIKRRIAAGEKQSLLAEEFGVSRTTITEIKIGRTWSYFKEVS
jgi:hypothetical protein